MRGLTIAFLAATASPAVSLAAAVTSPNTLFNMVCVGDKAGGFRYQSPDWVPTQFKPETRLLKKLDPNTTGCRDRFNRQLDEISVSPLGDSYGDSVGCYSFDIVGTQSPSTDVCEEEWESTGNATYMLDVIRCNFLLNAEVRPQQGLYVWALLTPTFATVDDRSPLVIEEGKCSML